jgi:3-oxoacyl-[acyl-carrier protein] reductase
VAVRALVTGASSGIGRAVAEQLLDDGWDVLGLSRTYPKGMLAYERFSWHHGDLLTGYGVNHLRHRLVEGLDAVVHAAAVQGPIGPLVETKPQDWLDCIRVNLIGTYRVVSLALPFLQQSEDGRLLLFSGGGAFNARPEYSAYAVAKAGVVSLMESLAAEMGDTVAVNCVSPGYVPTPMNGHPDAPSAEKDRAVACVMHLLSPETQGLTGRTISAEYDGWASLNQQTIPLIGKMGTRHRHKVWPMNADGSYVYRSDGNAVAEVV